MGSYPTRSTFSWRLRQALGAYVLPTAASAYRPASHLTPPLPPHPNTAVDKTAYSRAEPSYPPALTPQSLLTLLLAKNPRDRPSASQALAHAWFAGLDLPALRAQSLAPPQPPELQVRPCAVLCWVARRGWARAAGPIQSPAALGEWEARGSAGLPGHCCANARPWERRADSPTAGPCQTPRVPRLISPPPRRLFLAFFHENGMKELNE